MKLRVTTRVLTTRAINIYARFQLNRKLNVPESGHHYLKEPAQKAGFAFCGRTLHRTPFDYSPHSSLNLQDIGWKLAIRSYTQNNILNPVKTTIHTTFKNRPARISCCLIWPVAKTIAFSGVATGSIKRMKPQWQSIPTESQATCRTLRPLRQIRE